MGKINSIDIPRSTEEMAKDFVQNFHHYSRQGLLTDLGFLLSLFTNMTTFNNAVGDQLIVKIQIIRNQNIAHNYTTALHDADKDQSILALLSLLHVRDIFNTNSSSNAVLKLEEIGHCPKHQTYSSSSCMNS